MLNTNKIENQNGKKYFIHTLRVPQSFYVVEQRDFIETMAFGLKQATSQKLLCMFERFSCP